MEKKFCVYKHTFPNGKVYIGITSQIPEDRWCKGKGYASQKIIYSAILHYGWENIVSEIVCSNLDVTKAEEIEKELIDKYKSNNRDFGYNYLPGVIRTKEHWDNLITSAINNRKKVKQYDLNGIFIKEFNGIVDIENEMGISHSKISNCCNNKRFKAGGFIWRFSDDKITDEIIRKANTSNKGVNNSKSRKICQYDLDGVLLKQWNCLQDACSFYNISHSTISSCLNYKTYTCSGYVWRYIEDITPIDLDKINNKGNRQGWRGLSGKDNINSKPILQYSENGQFIKRWDCLAEAARYYSVNPGNISLAANNKRRSCAGYMWRYISSDNECKYDNIEPVLRGVGGGWNKGLARKNNPKSKPVLQYDLDNNFIQKWDCVKDAEESLNINNVAMCARGVRKSAGGYIWEYINNEFN